jgi:Transposase DDE domain group 1
VASDPTVSRTIDALAADAPAALEAIRAARAAARRQAGQLAGQHAPDAGITAASPLVIDIDAPLVTAHSGKELARPAFKHGYGHHPLWAFAGHGAGGTGEPLAVMLRAGNAGPDTAAGHVSVIRDALRQLPFHAASTSRRIGRKVLIRIDGAGATHEVVNYIVARRMSYSVGFALPDHAPELLKLIPDSARAPAYDSDGQARDGARVAELTGLLDLGKNNWPAGMRVIARKERPHPGAQLRITDVDGHRVTAFATSTRPGGPGTQLPDLELRHRRRARCEDRIGCPKDTGARSRRPVVAPGGWPSHRPAGSSAPRPPRPAIPAVG